MGGIFSLSAGPAAKDEVISKYEKAVALAEEMHVYQEDIFHILPKIRVASQALLKEDLQQADRVLNEALSDLEALQATHSQGIRTNFKAEWLEMYLDVFRHYAVLALLAYLLVNWSFFKVMLKRKQIAPNGKLLLTVLVIFFSSILAIFDLSRYGESAWIFFDIQLVLVVVASLLGGFSTGFFSGAGILAFRWVLRPEVTPYFVVVIIATVLGGVFAQKIKSFQSSAKPGFLCGLLVGLIHGIVVYFPMQAYLPLNDLIFSICFLAILEGGGVALVMGIIGGILREEERRDVQNELLKTKLLFLQAQLRPHFFFNALNTIAVICGRENALKAQNLIFRLADFLRHTLKREEETTTFREEMAFIDAYLEIEKARFQDKLQIQKEFNVSEKAWECKIPLLILQPLVENAIGHGIRKKGEGGGTLWITADDRNGILKIEIIDNGAGAQADFFKRLLNNKKAAVEGLGIGIRNIHQRLMRFFKGEAELDFETAPGTGTKATVKIPIRQEKIQ